MREYNHANVFVIQWTPHIAIQESDKSSHLTGRTLWVSKKLLYTICDVGHPHEMVFVEPSHVFLDEIIGDQDDCLAFELQAFLGWAKLQLVFVHSFPLQVKLAQSFSGKSFRKCPLGWLMGYGGKTYPNPSSLLWQYQPFLHDEAPFASDGRKGFPHSFPVLWDCAFASITLFRHESSIGSWTRCTICEGIFVILP